MGINGIKHHNTECPNEKLLPVVKKWLGARERQIKKIQGHGMKRHGTGPNEKIPGVWI